MRTQQPPALLLFRVKLKSMRWVRRLSWFVFVMALFITPWAFAYGPLFPWSAVKPGYTSLSLRRADVYYPKGRALDPAYLQIDRYLSEAEAFHHLSAPHRLRVIACANYGDFDRFSPLTTGAGAATLETGTAIYVSPKVGERGLDHGEFLRHEISHAIVSQNISFWRQWTLRHYTWLYEGVPVWFGRQRAYMPQEQFLARAKAMDLQPLFEFDAHATNRPQVDMRLAYVAWRDFLDYLAQHRGKDTFDVFFHKALDSPSDTLGVFEQVYGRKLPDMVKQFESAIRNATYRPVV